MTSQITEQNMLAIDCDFNKNQWIGVGDPEGLGTGFDEDGHCHLVIAEKDDPYDYKSVCITRQDVQDLHAYLGKMLGV